MMIVNVSLLWGYLNPLIHWFFAHVKIDHFVGISNSFLYVWLMHVAFFFMETCILHYYIVQLLNII